MGADVLLSSGFMAGKSNTSCERTKVSAEGFFLLQHEYKKERGQLMYVCIQWKKFAVLDDVIVFNPLFFVSL